MCDSTVKVGFFDSGIGGLTTLNACERYAKNFVSSEKELVFYYYGDNFRAPYGNLSEEKIMEYAKEAFDAFVSLQVDAVVIACNTVTAVCIEKLREIYNFPIVGIEPAVHYAAKTLGSGKGEILTLSTRATFLSKRFNCLCARVREKFPDLRLKNYACDGLAGAIEKLTVKESFDCSKFLPKTSASLVVLGCTHYGYVRDEIERFYSCRAIDGNEGVAKRLFSLLNDCGKLFVTQGVDFVDSEWLPLKGKVTHNAVDNSNQGVKKAKNSQKNEKIKNGWGCEGLNVGKIRRNMDRKNVRILFIGGGKMVNLTKYEQMFV